MVDQIKTLSEALLRASGVCKPPVAPLELIRDEPIAVVGNDYQDAFDARLEWRGDHFNLYYNTRYGDHHHPRVRFSIAHEIGHYSLPEHRAAIQAANGHSSCSEYVCTNIFERQADEFAANLLMPAYMFRAIARQLPDFKTLLAAAQHFQTSLLSTVRRFIQLTNYPCLLGVSDGHRLKWQVRSQALVDMRVAGLQRQQPLPPFSVTSRLARHIIAPDQDGVGEDILPASIWFNYSYPPVERVFEQAIWAGRYGYLTLMCVED